MRKIFNEINHFNSFESFVSRSITGDLMKSLLTGKLGNNYLSHGCKSKGPDRMKFHIYHIPNKQRVYNEISRLQNIFAGNIIAFLRRGTFSD